MSAESPVGAMAPSSPPPATRVSVVLPAFNGATEVERTLASLASQQGANMELLVLDDASKDDTAGVVAKFLGSHPSLPGRLIRHDENWGLSRTLNHGFRETTGEAVLVVHQDIALVGTDWVARALADLERSPTVAVVTGNYGLPAAAEVNFAQRVFGVMRRQFHAGPKDGIESVTFTEFKCDLLRRSSLAAAGGFPERFRIAGEDLWVSCALRAQGSEILKDFSLRSVQRFTGGARTVGGNLRKEFTFGKVIAGTLIHFRAALARGLQRTPYSRSRSWNRGSQPFVALGVLGLLILALLTREPVLWWALGVLVVARLGYYVARLFSGVRRILGHAGRALAESIAGAPLGLATDFLYSAGLATGIVSWAFGRSL